MTVPSETNRSGPYNGNGVTTVFNYGFRIVDEDHLRVILTSSAGVETVLVVDADYIVSDVGEPAGGQIALMVAPAAGETITILRSVPLTQETDLENQGAYYAETVEDRFDLTVMQIQQVAEEVGRAIRVPASTDPDTDLQLPAPEANKLIGWNETETGLQNVDPATLASVIAYGTANSDIFTGDGVQTVFTLSANPGALNNLDVAIGGVTQLPGVDYTWTSGTALTFTTAPANGVVILARYMQALAQGASDSAASVFMQSGTGATQRMAQDKLRETISVADFGAVGNGIADDTIAINRAIAEAKARGGGTVLLNDRHAISARIDIAGIPVILRGASMAGSGYQPVQEAGTELIWIGGVSAGAMVRVGNYGDGGSNTLLYGGLENIALNGGGQCAHGLELGDASRGNYRDVYIWNTTASGMHFIADNLKLFQPSIWNNFYNCRIDMRAALVPSANAHGILIDQGTGVSGSGITLFYFENLSITHSGGDGIRWVSGGDGFLFMRPQIFRADSETGYSIRNMHSDAATPTNHAIFYYPLMTAGAYFDHPGHHLGTYFHLYDSENLNTGNSEFVYGPGAVEVGGIDSRGGEIGITRLASTQDTLIDDPMYLIRYDVANQVVHTGSGNWKVAASGSAITSHNRIGGAIAIATQAVLNDVSALSNTSNSAHGVAGILRPVLQFGLETISTSKVCVIAGLFDNTADPPTNAVWVEYDPDQSSGQYRLRANRGGSPTTVVNSAGLTGAANPRLRWRISIIPGLGGEPTALFYVAGEGTANPHLWTLVGTISTNVPVDSTTMQAGVMIRAREGVAKSVAVGDFKLAHRINYL